MTALRLAGILATTIALILLYNAGWHLRDDAQGFFVGFACCVISITYWRQS
jgi:hypothetical protein